MRRGEKLVDTKHRGEEEMSSNNTRGVGARIGAALVSPVLTAL
jgi:hypothetical protein